MALIVWDQQLAEAYDETYAAMFDPTVVRPVVDLLADLWNGDGALEFAAGTGRIALPLAARGVPVQGLELSPQAGRILAA